MAYVIFNSDKYIVTVAKNLAELQVRLPYYGIYENNAAGCMIEISNEDFLKIISGENNVSFDNNVINYTPVPILPYNKEILTEIINIRKKQIEEALKKYSHTTFKTDLENYLNVINAIDTENISYPINKTFERYLLDLGHNVISPLQM